MSFANLSLGSILAGLAAIAGMLYLLQRLRVRHRELPVVTTLFWKEAVEDARARVLVKQFRHPWAYLFVLGIAALLWFGAAGPKAKSGGDREVVVLLDGSAGMTAGTEFEDTLALVNAEVESLPRDRRQVIFCGAQPRTLLARGEDALLLEHRSAGLSPEAVPESITSALSELARSELGSRPTTVYVAGGANVSEEFLALLPESLEVSRLERETESARADNRGITAIGVSEAASGAWNKVDLFVEVSGAVDPSATALTLTLDEETHERPGVREITPAGAARILYADLPATGQLCSVELSADSFPVDDRASIVLPNRPLIRVALSPELDAALRFVLEADPAVLLTSERPDVAIRRGGEDLGAGLPALEFVASDSQAEAFVLEHEPGGDSLEVLLSAVDQLGLSEIDATGLAQESAQTISVGALAADVRGIDVWGSLLSTEFNFTQSRAFPLFVAQSVRWLASAEEFSSFAVVGEPLREVASIVDETGRELDFAGVPFVPTRAGVFQTKDGERVAVSLGDAAATLNLANAGLKTASFAGASGGFGPAVWLILLAFLLLLVEWVLYRSGRMP